MVYKRLSSSSRHRAPSIEEGWWDPRASGLGGGIWHFFELEGPRDKSLVGKGVEIGSHSDRNRIEIGSKSDQNRINIGSKSDQNWTIGSKSDRNRIEIGSRTEIGSKSDRNRIKIGSRSRSWSPSHKCSKSDHDLDHDPLFCPRDFSPLFPKQRVPCHNSPPPPKTRQLFSQSNSWHGTGGSATTFSRDVLLCPFLLVVSLDPLGKLINQPFSPPQKKPKSVPLHVACLALLAAIGMKCLCLPCSANESDPPGPCASQWGHSRRSPHLPHKD